MTVKSLRKQIFEGGHVFGNTDHFAETITVQPVDGDSWTVAATVIVDQDLDTEDIVDIEVDRIWVQVARDSTATRGGIPTPEIGMTILRAGDDADNPWTFQGETRNQTPHSWELLFARHRPRRYGPRQAV